MNTVDESAKLYTTKCFLSELAAVNTV